jgi:hypothetical protein
MMSYIIPLGLSGYAPQHGEDDPDCLVRHWQRGGPNQETIVRA